MEELMLKDFFNLWAFMRGNSENHFDKVDLLIIFDYEYKLPNLSQK